MAIDPGTYDITIQRRSDHSFAVTLKDSSDAAINITGYTLASQVWDSSRTTKACDASISVTNASGGAFTWSVTDTQTTSMSASEYKYDVLFTTPAGLKEYWIEGTIFIDEGYTA